MTLIHEETGSETEWIALLGFQVCRPLLSLAVTQVEAAKTTIADEANISDEPKNG